MAGLEQQWATFRSNVRRAQDQAQQQQGYNNALRIPEDLERGVKPEPLAPKPEVIYLEEEDPTKLHYPVIHRWW